MVNIALTQKDFETLVDGGVVRKDEVQIILQDVGFYSMHLAIEVAEINDLQKKGGFKCT